MQKKRLLRNTLIYTLVPKSYFIFTLISTPLISPYLTLNDFGIYGLIVAYLNIFQILVLLGQNVVLQNAFFDYKQKYSHIWRRCFGLMMVAGIISSIILGLILYINMANVIGHNFTPVVLMLSLFLIFSPIEIIATNYYVLHEKPLPFAICSFLTGFISVILSVITIKYLHLGYLGWIIALPVNTIFMYVFYGRRLFFKEKLYPLFSFKKNFSAHVLKVGLPFTPHQLSLYILGTSDRLLLNFFKVPTAQIGFYSQGYNLGSYGMLLITGVFQALSRKLQEAFRGNDEAHVSFIRKIIILLPLSISILMFVGSLWMKEVFFVLYKKPELQTAYSVTIVVACSYMFWPIYSFFTIHLSIKGKTFSISKISLLAALFNIAGNLFFIHRWGIWAALISTYLSYVIFGIGGILYKENRLSLEKYINIKKFIAGMIFLNIVMLITAYSLKDAGYIYKLLLSSLSIAALSIIFKRTLELKFKKLAWL